MKITGTLKEIIKALCEADSDTVYDVAVEPHKEKRSLNANAYYWVLAGKLSQRINVPAEEIYRWHIKDLSNYQCFLMLTDAVESFKRQWCSGHLGRFVDTRESREPGRTVALAYYGSSDFNTSQMAKLIDNMVDDCEKFGIETMTPDEIERLKAAWNA